MTTISTDYYLQPAGQKISTTNDNGSLGKDAFMKILISQLQNQDPTAPMDDKAFISQMAQFSSLEQMQNMTTAMTNLLSSQQETQLMSYTNFIGKDIKWHEVTEKLDDKGKNITNEGSGTITELKFKDGEPIFILADGKELTSGNISSILGTSKTDLGTSKTEENPFVTASQLIGKSIQYKNGDDDMVEAIIESITNTGTSIFYNLPNDIRLTKDQFELL